MLAPRPPTPIALATRPPRRLPIETMAQQCTPDDLAALAPKRLPAMIVSSSAGGSEGAAKQKPERLAAGISLI